MNPRENPKNELLTQSLKVMAAVGVVAYVPSVVLALRSALWIVAVVDTAVMVVVLLAAFLPGMSENIRLTIFVSSIFMVAIVVLLQTGQEGAGYIWLLCATLMAALFGKPRIVVTMIVLSTVVMGVYGVLGALELLPFIISAPVVLVITSNLIAISVAISLILQLLVGRLEAALEVRERLTTELHYRVKDNMQTTLSLVALEADPARGSKAARTTERRLRILAAANETLLTHPETGSLSLHEISHILGDSPTEGYCVLEMERGATDQVTLGTKAAIDFVIAAGELLATMLGQGRSVILSAVEDGRESRVLLLFSAGGEALLLEGVAEDLAKDSAAAALVGSATVRRVAPESDQPGGFEVLPMERFERMNTPPHPV